jgi:sarcosine oxidase subunit gamma
MADLSEAPPLHRAVLRATAAPIALPAPLTAATTGAITALWQGPDEFLLLSPAPISLDCDTPHSLVDISHRQRGFILTGPDAEALLSTGCPLDLASLPVGGTTRTLYAKADITLWRTGPDTFHLEVARSFAPYLTALLAEAARGI